MVQDKGFSSSTQTKMDDPEDYDLYDFVDEITENKNCSTIDSYFDDKLEETVKPDHSHDYL